MVRIFPMATKAANFRDKFVVRGAVCPRAFEDKSVDSKEFCIFLNMNGDVGAHRQAQMQSAI